MAKRSSSSKPLPTGGCWCGCGAATSIGAYFLSGHDKRAEAAIVKVEYGDVPTLLLRHGYGPDGKNAKEELERFQREGGDYL